MNINEILKPRTPVYKQVKMVMPHCPVCKEMLIGNNSIASPWRCACGEWQTSFENPHDYRIKIPAL